MAMMGRWQHIADIDWTLLSVSPVQHTIYFMYPPPHNLQYPYWYWYGTGRVEVDNCWGFFAIEFPKSKKSWAQLHVTRQRQNAQIKTPFLIRLIWLNCCTFPWQEDQQEVLPDILYFPQCCILLVTSNNISEYSTGKVLYIVWYSMIFFIETKVQDKNKRCFSPPSFS